MIPPTIALSAETTNNTSAADNFVPPSRHGPWSSPKKPHKNVLLGFAVGVLDVLVLGAIDRERILRGLVLSGLIIFVLFFGSCGGSPSAPPSVASSTTKAAGTTLYNVQASDGWKVWGELAPAYEICSSCSPQVTWKMTQTGGATQFDIGGIVPYSDVLWSNPVIGQGSTQEVPDSNQTLVPKLKNFTYDAYFFSSNTAASQALEFDINQYFNGQSFIWGNQCRIAGGHEWDIWDNINKHWVGTGIPCNPENDAWNHVTIQVNRTSENQLLYQSITLNGVTSVLNRSYAPASAPSGWSGITLNFQMDGNYMQTPHTVFLDKLHFTYW
jgi:hypothetical protein